MLKVFHIISGDLWAGAEVMAYNLLKGLKAYNNLSLSAILLNEGKLAGKIRKLGIDVHVVDENVGCFFRILSSVRKILRTEPPDLIHSHRYKENILSLISSKGSSNAKLITTQHGMPEARGESISLKHRFVSKINMYLLSKCFDRVITVSEEMQNAFVNSLGFSEEKVMVIHNGMEIPELPFDRGKKECFVVGSSGRLFPVKDYPFMIEIAKAVSETTDSIRFQLAGDGPEMSKLRSIAEAYGLNSTFELKGHEIGRAHV